MASPAPRLSVTSLARVERLLGGFLVVCFAWALTADDWPQWLGPERDGIWREQGIVKVFPENGPKLRWRTEIGAGYAGPSVAKGRVFVTDRHMADLNNANANQNFSRGIIDGTERVLCLEEATGKILWEYSYDCTYSISYPAGPRAHPLVDGDSVFTLGAEGDLLCLDVEDGKVKWSREFKRDYDAKTPLWGFAAHPLLDGDKLICMVGGRDNATVVAFDKHSGREIWRALDSDELGYCPPVIFEAGGVRQLIIWHPQALNSLNPETGHHYWSHRADIKAGLTVATPRKAGDTLFVTSFYNGPIMMNLAPQAPKASLKWRGKSNNERNTDGLHSIMSTPFIEDGHIYGVDSYGQFRCLNAENGERIWETFKPTTGDKPVRWGNVFIIKHEDRYFLYNETGELIIANLSPKGYDELSRTKLLEPTNHHPRRLVVWSHPAFANRCVYARNDKEIVCYSLAAE